MMLFVLDEREVSLRTRESDVAPCAVRNIITVGAKRFRCAEVLFRPKTQGLHVVKGPNNFNGFGYFHVRLYADTDEEYVLFSASLRSSCWFEEDLVQKLSSELMSGQLRSGITVASSRW